MEYVVKNNKQASNEEKSNLENTFTDIASFVEQATDVIMEYKQEGELTREKCMEVLSDHTEDVLDSIDSLSDKDRVYLKSLMGMSKFYKEMFEKVF